MKKFLNYIILFLLILTCSCEKTLDFPFEYKEPKLVLNCILTADEEIDFSISRSMHILDSKEIVNITDADVLLYEDGRLLNVIARHNGEGYYHINYKPQVGRMYKFVVSKDKFKTIEAEVEMLARPSFESVKLRKKPIPEEYDNEFELEIKFTDAGNSNDYYMIWLEALPNDEIASFLEEQYAIYQEDGSYYYYNDLSVWCDDVIAESTYTNNAIFFSDEMINGSDCSIKFSGNDYTLLSPFEQLNQLQYTTDTAEIDLASYSFYEGYEYKFLVNFAAISKDYYLYLKSYNMYFENSGNPFSEPTPVRTNIKNGIGILGAASLYSDTLS